MSNIWLNTITAMILLLPINSKLLEGTKELAYSNSESPTSQDVMLVESEIEEINNEDEETESKEEKNEKRIAKWLQEFPEVESNSPQAKFINKIGPTAVIIAQEHGIYPSVMIAQAGLESNWGRSDLAQTYNNLMGTKGSWNGESIKVQTQEHVNGESVTIQAGFSVYDSWADSLYRYGSLMKNGLEWNPEYYKGTWRKNTDDYKEATAWLQGRYASDTSYADKLNQTIQSFNLERYDTVEDLDLDSEELLEEIALELESNA